MIGSGDQKTDDTPTAKGRARPLHEERRVTAWIGASIVIRGDLTSSEDMTIAGRVEGDVAAPNNRVTIIPGARIQGNVVARSVAVHGNVKGNITADQTIEVGADGFVLGDITAPRMVVAEGAVLHGQAEIAKAAGRTA